MTTTPQVIERDIFYPKLWWMIIKFKYLEWIVMVILVSFGSLRCNRE
jgi:hypothetical protein